MTLPAATTNSAKFANAVSVGFTEKQVTHEPSTARRYARTGRCLLTLVTMLWGASMLTNLKPLVAQFLLTRLHRAGLWIYRFSAGYHWATNMFFFRHPTIADFFGHHGCRLGEAMMRASTRMQR